MTADLPRQARPGDDAVARPPYDAARITAMLEQLSGDLAQFDEALDADLWMSSTVGHMTLQLEPEEDAQQTMVWAVEDVLEYLGHNPTGNAVAFLHAADILIPARLRESVDRALAASGRPAPVWARRTPMRVGRCWRMGSATGDTDEVVVSFSHAGRSHLLHVVIGPEGILDVDFSENVEGHYRGTRDEVAGFDGFVFEDLDPIQARALLLPALSLPVVLTSHGESDVVDSLSYVALLRHRVTLLPTPAGAAFFRG